MLFVMTGIKRSRHSNRIQFIGFRRRVSAWCSVTGAKSVMGLPAKSEKLGLIDVVKVRPDGVDFFYKNIQNVSGNSTEETALGKHDKAMFLKNGPVSGG